MSRCPRDTAALLLCRKVSLDGPVLLAPLVHDTAPAPVKVRQARTVPVSTHSGRLPLGLQCAAIMVYPEGMYDASRGCPQAAWQGEC